MAGMNGLGRIFDVVHDASGNMISFKNASAISFVSKASGASSVAFTTAKTFSGATQNFTTANGYGQTAVWYQNTVANGTAAWTKQTASWSTNSVTLAGTSGYVSVITVYTSQMVDPYCYIAATGTNTTTVIAYLHDLDIQRAPANLAILGA